MKSKFSLCTILFVASTSIYAATHIVTSLADDGSAGTLRSVVSSAVNGDIVEFADAISGGTIVINKDLGVIEISSSISVIGPEDAPISINGGANGCAYAGSSRTSGLFYASNAESTVTLKNIVFTGVKGSQNSSTPHIGPAVSILGNAIIENCCWTNNAVVQTGSYNNDTGDGGACLRVEGDLQLTNSKFVDNGMNSTIYSMGGNIVTKGEKISIKNCYFDKFVGWDNIRPGNSVRGGGSIAILGASDKDIVIQDCYFTDQWANASAGSIFVRQDVTGGTMLIDNCIFREIYGYSANGFSSGGGVISAGNSGSALKLIVKNTEFSNCGCKGYAGTILFRSSAYAVFVNCLFYNSHSVAWGGIADSRCNTYVINCTAVGSVNSQNNANACGAFFMESKTFAGLNSVFAWNYSSTATEMVIDDCSRYGGTVAMYNSFNGVRGRSPNVTDNLMTYDETTKMFALPLQSRTNAVVAGVTLNYVSEMLYPQLTYDEKSPKKKLAAVEILPKKDGGVLDMAGWPVKHSADWSSIAFSKDRGATWTALCGDVESATINMLSDSRGEKYMMSNDGLPVPPIGATTIKKPEVLMIFVH
jgi:hypothetical protein